MRYLTHLRSSAIPSGLILSSRARSCSGPSQNGPSGCLSSRTSDVERSSVSMSYSMYPSWARVLSAAFAPSSICT